MDALVDFHLFSFLPILAIGGTLWYERTRRHGTPKRTNLLLRSLAAITAVGVLQFAVWALKVPAWSQVFVLSGILYFMASFYLEYAIHVKRIEESFLTADFRREARGMRPWFWAMAVLAVAVIIVAPIFEALGFPHPIWGLIVLYEVALFGAAFLAGRRVFNLQEGVIRQRGYPFYAQMLVTVGLTVHLIFRKSAGVDQQSFPLFWFTLLNLVFTARLIEEFFFWSQHNLHAEADKVDERQSAQNRLIRRVISTDADDAALVRELAAVALEKAQTRPAMKEYRLTGLAVYRAVGTTLRIERPEHVLGYCTPLTDKSIKSLDKGKLVDLLTRSTFDLTEITGGDEPKDFGKRLLRKAFETREVAVCSELPDTLKGLQRLAIAVPIYDENLVVGCLTAFKDSFDHLLPAERVVLEELAETLSTVYALMRGKEAQRERTRLLDEMNMARALQTSILPRKAELPGFEVATFMETATEVGGDAYDFVTTPFGTYFGIGDVAGHGLPAGMMAVISVAALHGALEAAKALDRPLALDQVYDAVNRVLCTLNRDRLGSDKFMTQNYFLSDGATIGHVGTHLVAVVWRAGEKRVEELTDLVDQTGFLGLSELVVSTQSLGRFVMNKDDILVLYSDGVTEAKNGRGDEFGIEGLKRVVQKHGGYTSEEMIVAVMDELRRFAADGDLKKKHGRFADDVSLVVLKKE